jgi:coenzyme PQQ biosynthesis protein C
MAKSPDEFVNELIAGRTPREELKPTRVLLIQGKLTKDQVKTWVKQLYYYRVNVPRKELYILANCPIKDIRMELLKKYLEEEDDRLLGAKEGPHDELWIKLGEGLGVAADEMKSFGDLCPEYRLLVDSWVNYARDHSWLEGSALSFDEGGGAGPAGEGMKLADAFVKFYGVPVWGLRHLTLHSELDIDHGTSIQDLLRKFALGDEQQEGIRHAVRFKRAFHRMEDRCMRIACGIDPRLYVELETSDSRV